MMDSCTSSEAIDVCYEVFVVEFVAFVVDEMGKSEIVVVVVSGGGDVDHDMKMLGGVMMMKVL